MATSAAMIDLKEFPKPGVRIPRSLKRRINQYLLDHADSFEYIEGKGLTMEALFAVALLDLMAGDEEKMRATINRRIPELIAMFESDMPGAKGGSPAEREAGKDLVKGGKPWKGGASKDPKRKTSG